MARFEINRKENGQFVPYNPAIMKQIKVENVYPYPHKIVTIDIDDNGDACRVYPHVLKLEEENIISVKPNKYTRMGDHYGYGGNAITHGESGLYSIRKKDYINTSDGFALNYRGEFIDICIFNVVNGFKSSYKKINEIKYVNAGINTRYLYTDGYMIYYGESKLTAVGSMGMYEWESLTPEEKYEVFVNFGTTNPVSCDALLDDAVWISGVLVASNSPVTSLEVDFVPVKSMLTNRKMTEIKPYRIVEYAALELNCTDPTSVKVIVSVDGVNFKSYKDGEWIDVKTEIDDAWDKAIYAVYLPEIPKDKWAELLDGNTGLAFGYLMDIENIDDVCEIKDTLIYTSTKNNYKVAIPNVDYVLSYPQKGLLEIEFLEKGTYKINY